MALNFSKHFSFAEMTRTDTDYVNRPTNPIHFVNLTKLAYLLEDFRAFLNMKSGRCCQLPINVNSAFRSVSVNFAVGGVDNSRHLEGLAADIQVPGMKAVSLEEYLLLWWSCTDPLIHVYQLELVEHYQINDSSIHIAFRYVEDND